jgi:hypothetical protein
VVVFFVAVNVVFVAPHDFAGMCVVPVTLIE